jgi:hypothetical protein
MGERREVEVHGQEAKGEKQQEMYFRREAGNGLKLKEESRSPWTGSKRCT